MADVLFSIIIPSRGLRPRALKQAISSVRQSAGHCRSRLDPEQLEILVGFDGVKGERVLKGPDVHYFDLPQDKNWGNGVRNILLKRARGEKIVFLDDDNALTDSAFDTYLNHYGTEMLIARIDVSRAFECDFLPIDVPGKSLIRQGNIDPLCLCLSRELVKDRCGGWSGEIGYEADYLNMLNYHRRAARIKIVHDVVGIYDAGQGMDKGGTNFRQKRLLETGKKSRILT